MGHDQKNKILDTCGRNDFPQSGIGGLLLRSSEKLSHPGGTQSPAAIPLHRWLGHLGKMPPGSLRGDMFQAVCLMTGLGMSWDSPGRVGPRVWASQLRISGENGWMDGWIVMNKYFNIMPDSFYPETSSTFG